MSETDCRILEQRLRVDQNAPEGNAVEELRRILFDPRPHYCINGSRGRA